MRLGSRDFEAGVDAISAGAKPSGVVTAITEHPGLLSRVRRVSRDEHFAWLCDPVLFRTGLAGYRTSTHLQVLDYTPGRDAEPYQPGEFGDRDLARRVARSAIGSQFDLGASAAIASIFYCQGATDPWVGANARLLDEYRAAHAAFDRPTMVLGIPLNLGGYIESGPVQSLVKSASELAPNGVLLMLNGLTEASSPRRILAGLRVALTLQALGLPVVVSRPGDLRRIFLAFGVAGIEFGLGRYVRFSIQDYQGQNGPRQTIGPRFEHPLLACSLSSARAREVLGSSFPEGQCSCPVCTEETKADRRAERASEHNAHVIVSEAKGLAGIPITNRVAVLDNELQRAERALRKLTMAGFDVGNPVAVANQRRAIELGVRSGLLHAQGMEPGDVSLLR